MGRKPSVKNASNEAEQNDLAKLLLGSLLKQHENDHFNFHQKREFSVSTGSLTLDTYVKLTSGVHRFTGYSQSGKTSEATLIMRNGLATIPKSRGLYVKAEGRLSDTIIKRSGLKFVYSADQWDYGTVFVLESNIYETVVEFMEQLVRQAIKTEDVYFFIIDSLDGLILKPDFDTKTVSDGVKVAGQQVITKLFLRRLAPILNKFGHICIVISQVSADIKLDPYSPNVPRMVNSSGGNSITHYANYILEFQPRRNGDYILAKENERPDPIKNPILGHWVTVSIRKSEIDTENVTVKYPIKRGETVDAVGAIWREYEIYNMLLTFDLLDKSGAWLSVESETFAEMAKACNMEPAPENKFQGVRAFIKFLEANPQATEFFYQKFRALI